MARDLRLGGVERIACPTTDGWQLSLSRWRPRSVAGPGRGWPLLAIHGFSQNRRAFTRGPLARALVEAGFDLFLGELRGHGRSGLGWQPSRPADGALGWELDVHLTHDLPALVAGVKRASGRAGLLYVGHSMGGLLGYGLAAREPSIAGLCTLGSPLNVGADSAIVRAAVLLEPLIHLALLRPRAFPMDSLLALHAFAVASAPGWSAFERLSHSLVLLSNPAAADRETTRRLLRDGEAEPWRVLARFVAWARRGDVRLPHAAIDLAEAAAGLKQPLAVLFGERDLLAQQGSTATLLGRRPPGLVHWSEVPGAGHLELTAGRDPTPVLEALQALVRRLGPPR